MTYRLNGCGWVGLIVLACASVGVASPQEEAVGPRVLDVSGFGAVAGDGKDDAPAINGALEAAGEGDTVQIGKGTWEIGSTIIARSDVTLTGAGREETKLKFVGKAAMAMLRLEDLRNVTISKLTFDGDNSPSAAQGIVANKSEKINLNDVRVANLGAASGFGPHGVYFSSKVTGSIITNCAFANIGPASEWGAGIRIAHESSGNKVIGCTIDNTGRGGILVDNNSTDLVIQQNTITRTGRSNNGGGNGLGIELWGGAHRSVVEDNRLDHWLSVDSSNQVAVRRNVISDKSGSFKWTGLELVDSQDVAFTDNVVDGGAKIGISISGAGAKKRIYFGHNTVKDCSTWGAQVQGEAGKASAMYFYGNTFSGAVKQGPDTLYAPQGHGFRFNGGAENIVLDSNTIKANQGAGVQIAGEKVGELSFIKNTITHNGAEALDGPAALGTWVENQVSGNRKNNIPSNSGGGKLPFAAIVSEGVAVVGETLSFTVKATGIGPVTNVLWDFGDGCPVTSVSATHAFSAAGEYRVTAVAWDAAGRAAMCEMMVKVGEDRHVQRGASLEGLLEMYDERW